MDNKKFTVLVVDGLGVGEMPDVADNRHQDRGAHTLRNIYKKTGGLEMPFMKKLGMIDYFIHGKKPKLKEPVSLGKFALAHSGADSYIGHQELVGTIPGKPVRQFVRDIKDELAEALFKQGFTNRFENQFLQVGSHVAVADYIEGDYGVNMSVIGSLEHNSFDTIEQIGRIVRRVAKVGRIIVMGGTGISDTKFYENFEIRKQNGYIAWGINVPKLGIYNDQYQVLHLGYGINPDNQVTSCLVKHNRPVKLIGKAADVLRAPGADYDPMVSTSKILDEILYSMREMPTGLIIANIQETDLSGHEQNVARFAHYLEFIDTFLPKIAQLVRPGDIFLLTGDHGNDPTIGHSNHTREYTPLVMFAPGRKPAVIGERKTLADVGASVAKFFDVEPPPDGTPFI